MIFFKSFCLNAVKEQKTIPKIQKEYSKGKLDRLAVGHKGKDVLKNP